MSSTNLVKTTTSCLGGAHRGYLGNKKAGELAMKGSEDNEARNVDLPVPRTVWKNALRQRSHWEMREKLNDMPPHFRTE